jgi:hypothetical protein
VKLASFNLVGDEGSAHLDWLKELELSAQDKLAVAEEAMRRQASRCIQRGPMVRSLAFAAGSRPPSHQGQSRAERASS